jgi:toxin ParE1/3/4
MKLRYSRRALAELDGILADLASKNPRAAQIFATRIDRIVQRVSQFPEAFQQVAERPGVRRVPLLRYPYLLLYRVIAGEVTVLRIVHGARKEPWENL